MLVLKQNPNTEGQLFVTSISRLGSISYANGFLIDNRSNFAYDDVGGSFLLPKGRAYFAIGGAQVFPEPNYSQPGVLQDLEEVERQKRILKQLEKNAAYDVDDC